MHKAQAALMESMQKNMAAQNAQMPNMNMSMSPTVENAVGAAIYGIMVLYCIIALVTMLLPTVNRAFAGTSTTTDEPRDYYDPQAGQND
jgi:hypothetical protein